MSVKCNKCGSEIIELRRDGRGLPVAYCTECGNRIKNMSTGEVINYYEDKLVEIKEVQEDLADPNLFKEVKKEGNKPTCPYCLETYVIKSGRLGNIYRPVDIKYCPMCGRERTEEDFKFSNI